MKHSVSCLICYVKMRENKNKEQERYLEIINYTSQPQQGIIHSDFIAKKLLNDHICTLTLRGPFLDSYPRAVDSWSSNKHCQCTQRRSYYTRPEVTPPLALAELAPWFAESDPAVVEKCPLFGCPFEDVIRLVHTLLGHWSQVFPPINVFFLAVHPTWNEEPLKLWFIQINK